MEHLAVGIRRIGGFVYAVVGSWRLREMSWRRTFCGSANFLMPSSIRTLLQFLDVHLLLDLVKDFAWRELIDLVGKRDAVLGHGVVRGERSSSVDFTVAAGATPRFSDDHTLDASSSITSAGDVVGGHVASRFDEE